MHFIGGLRSFYHSGLQSGHYSEMKDGSPTGLPSFILSLFSRFLIEPCAVVFHIGILHHHRNKHLEAVL